MRLVCPNCGAKYEVPDDVIPLQGRDVQCSNCGDTWFQKHPSQDRGLAEDLQQPLDEAHWQDDTPPAPEPRQPQPQPEPDHWPETQPESAGTDHLRDEHAPEPVPEPAPEPEPEPRPEPAARGLSDDVRDVLREEARLESKARENAGGLEIQPDLGLAQPDPTPEDDADRRAREAQMHMSRIRGESAPEAAAALSGSRRDLLPDIEEINSTLRKSSARRPEASLTADLEAEPKKSGGFGRGFMLIVLLVVLALVVYIFAERIAGMVPALKPHLEAYVGLIDRMRAWLDGQVVSLLQWLDNATAAPAEPAPTPTPPASDQGAAAAQGN